MGHGGVGFINVFSSLLSLTPVIFSAEICCISFLVTKSTFHSVSKNKYKLQNIKNCAKHGGPVTVQCKTGILSNNHTCLNI